MDWREEQIEWEADGKPIRVGLTRFGEGPSLLLLPALSSISTRAEMQPLQERLGADFSTVAIDWPGFGISARPKIDWRPGLYRAFLRFVLDRVVQPSVTIAAGHASLRFVTGQLDPFTDRKAFLDAAQSVKADILLIYGSSAAAKSKAEMA